MAAKKTLTHLDPSGRPAMVDVSGKVATAREAVAECRVRFPAQVAAQLRAEGEELSQKIRSEADRERRVIMAEAERDAQKLRGEGDARATGIYADAYGEDPAFYAFHRSLEAYRKSFADGNAAIVLDEGDPFLEYLRDDQ